MGWTGIVHGFLNTPTAFAQPARFVTNGIVATGVHFGVLSACYRVLDFPSAGLSNGVAAVAGITVSFFGNRHFVFKATAESPVQQFRRFFKLYVALALMQIALLWLWSDFLGLDYRIGFLIGTAVQALISYVGGRRWVFR